MDTVYHVMLVITSGSVGVVIGGLAVYLKIRHDLATAAEEIRHRENRVDLMLNGFAPLKQRMR